jgi:type II secretory pathway component PulF
MPMYHYEATDASGKTLVGSMDARDEGAVRVRLAQNGYTPLLIETAGAPRRAANSGNGRAATAVAPAASSAGRSGGAATFVPAAGETRGGKRPGVSVSTRALAHFYRQMATSIRSGVPLTQAIPALRAQTGDKTLVAALNDIEANVTQGRPISEAMDRHPRAFSAGHVGLVKAGEGAGFLEKAFEELAVQAESDWGVEAATKFNIILFAIKWGGVPFMAGWVYWMIAFLPSIQNGITGGLAGGLRVLLPISIRAIGVTLAAEVVLNVLLPLVWKLFKGTPAGDAVNNLSSQLPLLGARRRRTDAVKALSSLSSAMGAGVPPGIAWQLAAEAPDTPRFRNAMARVAPMVYQGTPLPDVLTATNLFDLNILNMVRSGEMGGNMPEMLSQAVYYQREEAKHIGNLTPWLMGLVAYFLLLVIGGAMFIYMASRVYGGMINKALNM